MVKLTKPVDIKVDQEGVIHNATRYVELKWGLYSRAQKDGGQWELLYGDGWKIVGVRCYTIEALERIANAISLDECVNQVLRYI